MAIAKRFRITMAVFVVLGILEWFTLSAETVRVVTGLNGEPLFAVSVRGIALAVLALFAFRSWMHYRRELLEEGSRRGHE